VKKTRQNKEMEPPFRFNRNGKGSRTGENALQNLRVAVDVGGTFTDICIMDETTGLIRIEKTASSKDPIDAIMAGVDKAAIDLGKVALFSHGTTVADRHGLHQGLP